MNRNRVIAATVATVATLSVAALTAGPAAQAQNYPSKPIRLIVPLVPGGNLDIVARAVAGPLGESLGQQIIVENRAGASSLVGTQFVAKAPADGYTLLAIANTFATVPSLMKNSGYDAIKDFVGVSLTCLVPQVLVVTPSLPVRTVKDLVALGKARPGQLAYGTSGAGSTGHIAAELLSLQSGIKMLHVPYKGNAATIVDVIAGNVQLMFDQVSTSKSYVDSGRLRALGVTSLKRSPLYPDVPTIDESGLKGYDAVAWTGLSAPAKTPPVVVEAVNGAVAKIINSPEFRERLKAEGSDPVGSTPERFAQFLEEEITKWRKVIEFANVTPE